MPVTSYDWIKQIPTSILEQDSTPLVGFPPAFPLEQFAKKIKDLFSQDIQFKIGILEWKDKESLLSSLGENLAPFHFSVAPIDSLISFFLPEVDLFFLIEALLQKPSNNIPADFKEGFLQFLSLEIATILQDIEFDKELRFYFAKDHPLPETPILSLDIGIIFPNRTLQGKLIICPEFQKKWKERYAKRSLNYSLASKLDLLIHLEAGKVSLTAKEWGAINPGDFLLLDSCSLKPNGEGKVNLTINDIPLFRGKIKAGNIKILEHSLYHEVNKTMNNEHNPQDDNSELNEEEEIEEQDFQEDLEENEVIEEIEDQEDLKEEKWPPLPEKGEKKETKTDEITEEPPISFQDVPLSIVVEVGRIHMSIQKLMELTPGNVLDLNIHPEDGVDLVVSGKRIAKGELLLIGETLGIRILDIG